MFRIVVATPDELTQRQLVGAFGRVQGLDVVGVATDGVSALQLVQDARPDVVFVDVLIPPLGGVALITATRRLVPDARVVLLPSAASPDAVQSAIAAGACGVLHAEAAAEDLRGGLSLFVPEGSPLGPPGNYPSRQAMPGNAPGGPRPDSTRLHSRPATIHGRLRPNGRQPSRRRAPAHSCAGGTLSKKANARRRFAVARRCFHA